MRSRHISIFAIGILVLMLAVPAVAEEPADEPKLVLVLSGGGARGFAHVGVLRVLEELHIAPDLIVGTSMGSIVGGLYAAGWSPDDIEAIIEAINWHDIFTDRVDRKNRAFRRKQDDQPVMIQGRLHFDGFKPVLPSGVIDGQRLEIALHIIETLSPASTDFDNLPIPFRAVAANIATGEAVVIDSGELATALRASMSIPGALPPVMVNGQELVDGGIAANLPVGIAKSLGATQIIAVDISSPLLAEDHQQFSTFMSVFTHLNSLLTVGNRERDTALLGPEDLLIVPDLGDITFVSFDRAQDAIAIGEEAARRRINKLQKYVATKPRWAQFNRRTRADGLVPIQVDRIRLENTSLVDDRLVGEALTIDPPANLDWNVLGFDLLELYNDRYFGVIAFHVDEVEPEVNELVVDTPPPAFGRGSIQFGLGFKDDFAGDSSYHLQVRHQYLPANRRGGEWETLLQLGTVGGVRTTYYQPLDWGMRWFVEPSLSYERGVQDIWLDGQAIAEYEFRTADARLAAGRVLGRWGELRLAAFIRDNRGSPRIGSPEFQSVDDRRAGGQALFRIDTRDSVVFPQSGSNVHLDYTVSSETLGSETEFEQFWGSASYAWTFGKNTLLPAVEYGTNLIPAENFFSAYFIGGLFRLSGLGNRELFGEKIALARMVAYRRLFSFSVAGSGIKIYAGLSLEAGNAYFPGEDVTWGNTLKSGSIFVGGDTFIGPIIFAYGRSEGNRDRIYLGIGDNF